MPLYHVELERKQQRWQRLSEHPFANFKGVTRLKYRSGLCLDANHLAILVEAPDVEVVLLRSTGEATGHRDGVHGSQVAHVRIIAGLLNLADHVEGAAVHDFRADTGIDQVVRIEFASNLLLQLGGRRAVGRDVADQGESKDAIAIESVLAREGRLSEDSDSQSGGRAKPITIAAERRPCRPRTPRHRLVPRTAPPSVPRNTGE